MTLYMPLQLEAELIVWRVRNSPDREGSKPGRDKGDSLALLTSLTVKRSLEISSIAFKTQTRKRCSRRGSIRVILAISNQQSTDRSHMRIIDPADDEPLIELGDQQSDEINLAARRIEEEKASEFAKRLDVEVDDANCEAEQLNTYRGGGAGGLEPFGTGGFGPEAEMSATIGGIFFALTSG
jgi:hypothetical protein